MGTHVLAGDLGGSLATQLGEAGHAARPLCSCGPSGSPKRVSGAARTAFMPSGDWSHCCGVQAISIGGERRKQGSA
jgi:hypothetical protein